MNVVFEFQQYYSPGGGQRTQTTEEDQPVNGEGNKPNP